MASFEDRELLEKQDLAIIKKLGLKYRGQQAWPLFRRMRPFHLGWFLTAPEARFLTQALRQAKDVGLRYKMDPGYLNLPEEGKVLVRVRKETESGFVWVNEKQPMPEPPVEPEPVPPYVPNDLEAARLERLPNRPQLRIDVNFLVIPTPIMSEDGPYVPYTMLSVESQSGAVLGVQVAEPWDYRERFGRAAVQALETLGGRPGEIRVGRQELVELLSDIGSRFGIPVTLSGDTPTLDEAFTAFREHFTGADSSE